MSKNIGLIVAVVVMVAISFFITLPSYGAQYQMRGYIYAVDYQEDITLIMTEDGNIWGMKGTETWPKGTDVIVTMEDSNTATKIDDALIKIERAL